MTKVDRSLAIVRYFPGRVVTPLATVHGIEALQERRQKARHITFGGERRCKIASPLLEGICRSQHGREREHRSSPREEAKGKANYLWRREEMQNCISSPRRHLPQPAWEGEGDQAAAVLLDGESGEGGRHSSRRHRYVVEVARDNHRATWRS
jgi:hypothetical protein